MFNGQTEIRSMFKIEINPTEKSKKKIRPLWTFPHGLYTTKKFPLYSKHHSKLKVQTFQYPIRGICIEIVCICVQKIVY